MAAISIPHNWKPRPYQWPAWKYLQDGGRQCELVWHRRSGKDDLSLHHTAVSMYKRTGNFWHMLPKANQARKALWEAVNPHSGKRRIDEAFPPELRTGYNDHEMMLKMGRSTWQVLGSDNYDALVGSPPIGLVFSEWALSDPASFAYLRPILAENGGWVIKNTTPRGKNHAYRTFKSAQKDPDAFAQLLTAKDTDVFTDKQLEKELHDLIDDYGPDYGQAKFDQEYMCSWDAANLGAILGRWLQRAHTQNRITDGVFDPYGAPIEISADIGFRDTAAWWFWQPRKDGFGIVDYLSGSGMEAHDWIGKLREHCEMRGYTLGKIWLPQDARAKTFGSRHSPMEQFLAAFGSNVVRMVPPTKVLDRVNAARTVIERCVFDDVATDEGREALSAWQFEYDDERKEFSKEPRHDWACFSPETEVLTRYGTCQIMNLPQNGEVLTPCGWKRYEGPKITRRNAPLVEVVFSDGHTVKCTPDHLFLTGNGWKSAESLTKHSLILSSLTHSRSISMAVFIACGRAKDISLAAAKNFIGMFGSQPSDLSPTGVISTIGIQSHLTTYSATWNVSTRASIFDCQPEESIHSPLMLESVRRNGTNQKKAVSGTAGWLKPQRDGSNTNTKTSLASIAARWFQCWYERAQQRKNTVVRLAAPLRLESVKPLKEFADTWCIHVPDGEWFSLANGAVVHNSHGSDSFSYGCLVMREREIEDKVPETFEDARTRFTKELMRGALTVGAGGDMTMNDAWATVRPASERI